MTRVATVWGIGGVVLLLSVSVVRLSRPAIEALTSDLTALQWGVTGLWCAFMLYAEAWRGFHKQFSPRVVQRGFTFPDLGWKVVLAPPICMGLLHATKKRKIVGWCLVSGIFLLVLCVRQLGQPWRGVVDLGVVLGLGGGTMSILFHTARAVAGTLPGVPADWPE